MIKYILLGIIQGLTEFLPVSSSAHLIIMQKALGMAGEELALAVFLHLGTLLALIVFFFRDIVAAMRSFRMVFFITVVTVPCLLPGSYFLPLGVSVTGQEGTFWTQKTPLSSALRRGPRSCPGFRARA